MTPEDQEMFNFDMYTLDWKKYASDCFKGIRQFLIKDTPDTLEAARKKHQKLKIAHYIITISFKMAVAYLVFSLFSTVFSWFL